MRINLNNGFSRLAVVFIFGWWLVWGIVLYRAAAELHSSEGGYNTWLSIDLEDSREYGKTDLGTEDELKAAADDVAEARRWRRLVLQVAFGGFFAIPVAFASGAWVWRGFQNSN
jgi:hypothetical protein